MSKNLTIIRNETCTYAVRIEMGMPPENFAGGQSLDRERLATELSQHGCADATIAQALYEVENVGVSRISL